MAHDPIYLNAFWEGTANTLNPPTTQISLFAQACAARDISYDGSLAIDSDGPFKIAFDGCGVTNGISGTLFASGLRDQAKVVADHVHTLMSRERHVVLNAIGLSRGGIAVIFLCQALEGVSPDKLTLNALLFDPVPGDQTISGFPWTGFNAKDVSRCKALKKVLAIYPYEPLPWISFHAPVLVKYPLDCLVEEDVWLGCHQGALFATGRSRDPMTVASNLSFRRIVEFCEAVGVPLHRLENVFGFQPTVDFCLQLCRETLQEQTTSHRDLHDGPGFGRSIVRRQTGQYLNKFHEALEVRLKDAPGGAQAPAWIPNTMREEDQASRYMLGFDISKRRFMCT
jgi:hypothetical protein